MFSVKKIATMTNIIAVILAIVCVAVIAEDYTPVRLAVPEKTHISEQQAIDIARAALMQEKQMLSAQVDELEHIAHFVLLEEPNTCAWVVTYCCVIHVFGNAHDKRDVYVVMIDGRTGVVLDTHSGASNGIIGLTYALKGYDEGTVPLESSRFYKSLYSCPILVYQQTTLGDHLPFPVGWATPTKTDISEERAVSIAREELLKTEKLTVEQADSMERRVNFVLLNANDSDARAWVVAYCFYPIIRKYAVIIEATSGKILDTQQGFINEIHMRFRDGGMNDTIEEMALFDAMYNCENFLYDHVLPAETDISQVEALRIATLVLREEFGKTDDDLGKYNIDYRLGEFYDPPGVAFHRRWDIAFTDMTSYDSKSNSYTDRYQVSMDAANGSIVLISPYKPKTK